MRRDVGPRDDAPQGNLILGGLGVRNEFAARCLCNQKPAIDQRIGIVPWHGKLQALGLVFFLWSYESELFFREEVARD